MAHDAEIVRSAAVALAIRDQRLIAVLRRIAPRDVLLDLVDELESSGVRIFEVTLDGPDAGDDLAAVREHLVGRSPDTWVGAGTVRTVEDVRRAVGAGAAFGVSPVFDRDVLAAAFEGSLPFIPGAYTPTEIDAAWRAGAMFVKLFPGSSAGPAHVREVHGPLPDVELVVTGGIDAANALEFLAAGASAVGVGSAIVRATPAQRRGLVAAVRAGGQASST